MYIYIYICTHTSLDFNTFVMLLRRAGSLNRGLTGKAHCAESLMGADDSWAGSLIVGSRGWCRAAASTEVPFKTGVGVAGSL